MSFWRHYFSLFRVKQRRAMLLNFVPVLCLIGLLQSPILLVRGEPQLGVPFPDGKIYFFFYFIFMQIMWIESNLDFNLIG